MNLARLTRLSSPWARVITVFALWNATNEARSAVAASASDGAASRMEALFSTWASGRTPGVTCLVLHDGKVVYAKSQGMADVERSTPITSESIFNVGSMAKQFTGACVARLILDGKITADTDIRTFFPQLRDYGATVTVGHLIHHTSGIRDYTELVGLSGWTEDEPLDNAFVIDLLARQRLLEFAPGSRFGYSNSNYVLLAEIIRRVSGQSLNEFAQERFFAPLGMNDTRFATSGAKGDSKLARSYRPDGRTVYRDRGQTLGDSNLWTTAADLAQWDENLRTGKVGGKGWLELIQQRALYPNGQTGDYGFGLFFRTYRDQPVVEHSGLIAGYRSELLRLPQQQLSVIILGNVATVNAEQLARSVVDVYLGDHLPAASRGVESLTEVQLNPAIVAPYVGRYALDEAPDVVVSISTSNGAVFARWSGQERLPIFPYSEHEFFYKAVDARIAFHRGADGVVNRLTLHQNGEHEATRLEDDSIPVSEFGRYAGVFYSEELNASYTIACENNTLIARTSPLPHSAPLKAVSRDRFALPSGDAPGNFIFVGHGAITFRRDGDGRIVGFLLSGDRVTNISFERKD